MTTVENSAKLPSKSKDGWIQLMDYNMHRFDIKDVKGEILLHLHKVLSTVADPP
jgi:hypothetical protein